jgi:hypothetical protein
MVISGIKTDEIRALPAINKKYFKCQDITPENYNKTVFRSSGSDKHYSGFACWFFNGLRSGK